MPDSDDIELHDLDVLTGQKFAWKRFTAPAGANLMIEGCEFFSCDLTGLADTTGSICGNVFISCLLPPLLTPLPFWELRLGNEGEGDGADV